MDPAPERPPRTRNEWGVVAILSFFFAALLVAELARNFEPAKLSVPFFLLSWALLLAVHELAHAAAAAAVGWRIDRISIGIGRVVVRLRLGDTAIEFRLIPLAGFVLPRPTDLVAPRAKQFLIFAAGPGSELLLVAIVVLLVGLDPLTRRTEAIPMIATQSFCVAALWGALFNLIPFPVRDREGSSWSDGLGMIRCWSLPDSWFESQIGKAPGVPRTD